MLHRRTAVTTLLALSFAATSVFAQDRTASFGGFGGLSTNTLVSNATPTSRIDFGVDVSKALTPNVQVTGEFGRIADMLPSLTTGLVSLTPYDVRVPAYYGEGGIRLLAAPGSGVNPYVEATAGFARLTPQVSGLGSRWDAAATAGLNLFSTTDPLLGVGGGVLLRGGPIVADIGYRYKQVIGGGPVANVLSFGDTLRTHQVRFGIGVRF